MASIASMVAEVNRPLTKEEMSQKLDQLLEASRNRVDSAIKKMEHAGIKIDMTPMLSLEGYCRKYNRDQEIVKGWIAIGIVPAKDAVYLTVEKLQMIRDKEYVNAITVA